jgi:hypothetical protein
VESSFLIAFPTTQPTSAHDLPILPELPLPPGVAFLAIGDQTTPELAIRPPGLRHLHPYCHSHTQPPRIGQTGIAEWCRQIHSYDHWIEIQVVGGDGKQHRELEGARGSGETDIEDGWARRAILGLGSRSV